MSLFQSSKQKSEYKQFSKVGGIKGPLATIGGLFVLLLAGYIGKAIKEGQVSTKSVETQLIERANEFNKKCPIMVNDESRCDEVIAGPGKRITYMYTVISIENTEPNYLNKKITDEIFTNYKLNTIKKNEESKELAEKGVEIYHIFKAKDGTEIGRFTINSSDYQ